MDLKLWLKQMTELDIIISDNQLNQLEIFYQMLIEKNKVMNLTTIVDKKEVYYKHFYDSASLVKVINLNKINNLCDFGSGAGFPGIVLKIVFPNLNITLLDALQKRVIYLNDIISKLNLQNICAIHERGEFHKNQYDIVTARAVANIEKLVTYTMPLLKKDGLFIAMKGNISEELNDQVKKKLTQKYKLTEIKEFTLPKENSKRSLIVLQNKISK